MKKERKKVIENIFKFDKEMQERKRLPQEIKKKIRNNIVINFIIILLFTIYLTTIKILEENIPTENYLYILKTFSIIFMIVTIIMIEIAYKKNRNDLILDTIELLILTFFNMYLIYAYLIFFGQFYKVTATAEILCIMYYAIKTYIINKSIKRKYTDELSDIKTIVAKKKKI